MNGRNLVAVGALIGLLLALCFSDAKAHVRGCHTRACDRRIHARRAAHWCQTHIWECRWHHVSPALKDRLARLRHCESTDNYRASNGSHWGGYQYSWGPRSAGVRAGFRVRPDHASPREQDVRTAWFFPSHASEWECRA